MRTLLPFTTLLALTSAAPAQTPPPGGFAITEVLDQPVVYSDGYQSLLDLRHPDVTTPPPGGFPLLLVVHGGSTSRKVGWAQSLARLGARMGYVTAAYDTGNNGATLTLNPPGTRQDEERLTDMAEILALTENTLGQMVDSSRIAIFGKSGGGKHALWGAAFSGQPLLVPGSVTDMPVISAVHTDIQVLDRISDTILNGNLFKADRVKNVFAAEGLTGPTAQMILARDYAGWQAAMQAEPMELMPRLQTSSVPMAVSYSYDDSKHFVNVNADALQTLPLTTPTRYLQLTGGHGSADNVHHAVMREDFTLRWCDRWLKGVLNDVSTEAFADVAVLPSAPADYVDPQTEWRHRQVATWPTMAATAQRVYLRTAGQLTTSAPATPEPGPTVAHRVATGYDLVSFIQEYGNPAVVAASIPLVTETFDTPATQTPQELLGRAVVELEVTTTGQDCQLQAALLDVSPNGAARFVTSGVAALRNAPAGRHHLRIELGDVGYVLQPGHALRLSLENVNLRRQPGHWHYYAVPDFEDVDITVMIDPTFAPYVDLPLQAAQPSLLPRMQRASVAAGVNHALTIQGESSRAFGNYHVLMGFSGAAPGAAWGALTLPLEIDPFTYAGVSLTNTAVLQQFAGTLDAAGSATAVVALPPVLAAAVIGQRFTFAAYGIIWWRNRADWEGAVDSGEVLRLAIATILLVAADVAAMRAFKRVDDRPAAFRLTAVTLVTALVYVVVQSISWFPLIAQGDPDGDGTLRMEGFLFLMLTIAHAAHVLGGVVANGIVLARSTGGRGPLSGSLQLLYGYWRFLTVMWVAVLALLLGM